MGAAALSVSMRNGEGPVSVFLHGLQGNKSIFNRLINERIFKNKAVLSLDFPGFGESREAPVKGYTVSDLASVVADVLEKFDSRKIILIGHSLGGVIGVKLMDLERLNIAALISLEGNLTLADCGASLQIANISKEEFCSSMLPRMKWELAELQSPSAQFRARSLNSSQPEAIYAVACSIVEECRGSDLLRKFEAAQCEKLLLVGERSSFSTRRLHPSVQVNIVPGATHFILQDNYEYTQRKISTFLLERNLLD